MIHRGTGIYNPNGCFFPTWSNGCGGWVRSTRRISSARAAATGVWHVKRS